MRSRRSRRRSGKPSRPRPLGLFEQLETRLLLASDWQNSIQPLDANDDLLVSPADVLVGVNRLNRLEPPELGPRDADSTAPFYDVNGDSLHSPADILAVINGVNSGRPLLAARLANDTAPDGAINRDGLTSQYTIHAAVSAVGDSELKVRLAGQPTAGFVDVSSSFSNGRFVLDEALLDGLNGGPLGDGQHTLLVRGENNQNVTPVLFVDFTLDRVAANADVQLPPTLTVTTQTIEIQFDEPVAAHVFDAANFRLLVDGGPQDGQAVPIAAVESVEDTLARVQLDSVLSDQSYRLEWAGPLNDLVGNQTMVPATSFTVMDPTGLASLSPEAGEAMVSIAREAVVRFDEPVDPSTVDADSFFLLANGQRVAGDIRVSATNRFATLIPDNPLPPSTEIRLVVDGNLIDGADGLKLDADGDNVPGGIAQTTFRTLPLTRIPGTNVFGFVRDSLTGEPLVGATIRVDAFPAANVVTDSEGRFELVDMPAPEFFVHVDGSTASHRNVNGTLVPIDAGMTYPNVGKPFHSVPGQTVQLEMAGEPFDVFLPEVAVSDIQPLSGSETTQVGFGANGKATLQAMFPGLDPAVFDLMQVEFVAGSAINDQGQPATQAVVVPVPPDRIPAPLPPNLDPSLVVSIQSPGATSFDTPATITYPNLDGLAAGEQSLIYSFDHDAGRWKVVGTGTVSEDASVIVSDGGVIQAPGWGFTRRGFLLSVLLGNPNNKLIEPSADLVLALADNAKGLDSVIDVTASGATAKRLSDVGLVLKGTSRATPVISVAADSVQLVHGVSEAIEERSEDGQVSTNTKLGLAFSAGSLASTALLILGCGSATVVTGGAAALACGAGVLGTGVSAAGSIATSARDAAEAIDDMNAAALRDCPAEHPQLAEPLVDAREELTDIENQADAAAAAMTTAEQELAEVVTDLTLDALDEAIAGPLEDVVIGLETSGAVSVTDPGTGLPAINPQTGQPYNFTIHDAIAMLDADTLIDVVTAALNRFDVDSLPGLGEAISDWANSLTGGRTEQQFHDAGDSLAEFGELISDTAGEQPYLIRTDGLEIRGKLNDEGKLLETLPSGQDFELLLADPISGLVRVYQGTAGGPGRLTQTTSLVLAPEVGAVDSDTDGLSDLIEQILGTDANSSDTDNDGIGDQAEVIQSLNPLDDRGFPTGVIASLPLMGQAKRVVLEGSTLADAGQTAYLATGFQGLAIVDATRFDQPIVLGQIDLDGDATDVAVDASQQLAVVAANSGGLHLVDVSDPLVPVLERTLSSIATHVEVSGGVAYAAVGGELHAYDLLSRTFIDRLQLSSSSIRGLARENSFLYVMDDDTTLHVVELGTQMIARGNLQVAETAGELFAGGGIVYAAATDDTFGGFATIDVADPDNPQLISLPDHSDGTQVPRVGMVTNGSGLGLLFGRSAGQPAIELYDVSDPAQTGQFLSRLELADEPKSVAIGSGIAYAANGNGGLQVVNYLAFDNLGNPPSVQAVADIDDFDPGQAGLQVQEGTRVPILVPANDDVQLRQVELLVDGELTATDVSFPFDFSIVVPQLDVASSATVQVRAEDTGGNQTTSAPLTIEIVEDVTGPFVTSFTPSPNGYAGSTLTSARVAFSEAMDSATLTPASLQLFRVDGGPVQIPLTGIERRFDDQVAQLRFAPLAAGEYEIRVDQAAVTDRSGNAMGAGAATSSFTVVEATAVWTNPVGGNWEDPRNWSGGQVPGPEDDVFIGTFPDAAADFRFSPHPSVRSVTLAGDLILNGTLVADRIDVLSGRIIFDFGEIQDAVVTVDPSANIDIPRFERGTLDGVTLNGALSVQGLLVVENGLTLGANSLVTVGMNSTTTIVSGDLAGSGTVELLTTSSRLNVFDRVLPGVLIRADGGILGASNTSPYTLQGVVEVTSGGLTLTGNWSNQGVLRTTGGTLLLDGTFTSPTSSGVLENFGGEIQITGTLENDGGRFTIDAATGDVLLKNGKIMGGIVETADGARLIAIDISRIYGITMQGDLVVPNLELLVVHDGLTLDNGTVDLQSTGSSTWLDFEGGDMTLGGTGTILFSGGDSVSDHQMSVASQSQLTIEAGITVRGSFGELSGTTVSEGTIRAEGAGELRVGDLLNRGLVQVDSGTLRLTGDWANEGTLRSAGGLMILAGRFPTPTTGGDLQATGGLVEVRGIVENAGNTWVMNDATGDLVLENGARVNGGTIRTDEAAQFMLAASATATLDALTLQADLHLEDSARLRVEGGMTLAGSTVQFNSGAQVDFSGGVQLLGGTGEFLFLGGNVTGRNRVTPQHGDLIVDSGLVFRGANVDIPGSGQHQVVHRGAVIADRAGDMRLTGVILDAAAHLSVAAGSLLQFDDLTLTSAMTVEVAVRGIDPSLLGRIEAEGDVIFAGTLQLDTIGLNAQVNDEFRIISYDSHFGQFDSLVGDDLGTVTLVPSYRADELTLVAT